MNKEYEKSVTIKVLISLSAKDIGRTLTEDNFDCRKTPRDTLRASERNDQSLVSAIAGKPNCPKAAYHAINPYRCLATMASSASSSHTSITSILNTCCVRSWDVARPRSTTSAICVLSEPQTIFGNAQNCLTRISLGLNKLGFLSKSIS